jgi:hypothetical protein
MKHFTEIEGIIVSRMLPEIRLICNTFNVKKGKCSGVLLVSFPLRFLHFVRITNTIRCMIAVVQVVQFP